MGFIKKYSLSNLKMIQCYWN